jgi:gamma-glutamylcyclotransferase (GGCT)/AIG2-like uncharacterized protein YtfP
MRLFVYGTLRPGGRYWAEELSAYVEAVSPTVIMPGLDLFGGPGFPIAATNPLGDDAATGVVGEVVAAQPKWTGVVLERLDVIEGHPRLFERVERDGVWVYVATPATLDRLGTRQVPSGDWFDLDDDAQRAWSAEVGRQYVGPAAPYTLPLT